MRSPVGPRWSIRAALAGVLNNNDRNNLVPVGEERIAQMLDASIGIIRAFQLQPAVRLCADQAEIRPGTVRVFPDDFHKVAHDYHGMSSLNGSSAAGFGAGFGATFAGAWSSRFPPCRLSSLTVQHSLLAVSPDLLV